MENVLIMKRKVLKAAIIVLIVWYILGLAIKRNAVYLIESANSSHLGKRDNCPVFGVQFPFDAGSDRIVWLSDEQRDILWEHILKGEETYNETHSKYLVLSGRMFIYPHWVTNPIIKYVFLPMQPYTEIKYVPAKEYLYISEDCFALMYECMKGLGVKGIKLKTLGFDTQDIISRLLAYKIPVERWQLGLEELIERVSKETGIAITNEKYIDAE